MKCESSIYCATHSSSDRGIMEPDCTQCKYASTQAQLNKYIKCIKMPHKINFAFGMFTAAKQKYMN